MKTEKTEAFDLALKFINETNVNVFLTGKAGTGKTTFLKYLKENPMKNMAVAAPTGVAAINAGGVTLHSMFQLPFGPFLPVSNHIPNPAFMGYDKKTLLGRMRFNSEKLNFFNALELLIIDEASMVAAHTIDAIDTILRAVRHKQVPFGGVQVLFIGDLYQLQPVTKEDEWRVLKTFYSSNFFFDSHVLRDNIPVMIELKKIFRQKDEAFINILNGLRENKLTHGHQQVLNQRLNRNFISAEGDGYITLTTHNANANQLNEIKLNRLKSPVVKFSAIIEDEFPENMFPAEKELMLKKGAQVMFIKNDTEGKKYFNGKIGVIGEITDEEIVVQCGDEKIDVYRNLWENLNYSVDPETKEIKETVLGTFMQYPLRLAWAITIHKSQGLTFDKVVIDAENAFANGQVYVALSRATALEGLILTSPVNDRFLGPHADLKNWTENKHDEKSLPVLFEKARQEFMKQLLFNVFSFEQFIFPVEKLKRNLDELDKEVEVADWFKEIRNKLESMNATAFKFRQQLQLLWNENPEPAVNVKLNTRIKDAAIYFYGQLEDWRKLFAEHPLQVSTRKLSRPIDKALEEINEQLQYSLTKAKICKDGFVLQELSLWKKALPPNYEKIKSSYGSTADAEVATSHSDLYALLAAFRNEVAEENDIPPYMIFSNKAIKSCCEIFPGDKKALLSVEGFGKRKVKDYGTYVLQIISGYCQENSIAMNYSSGEGNTKLASRTKKELSPTVIETVQLLNSGLNISEIAAIRNFAASTIEGHLALAIKYKLVTIDQLLPEEEVASISSFFTHESLELNMARQKSGGKVSFGKLKMVQAWLIASKIQS